MGEGGLLRFADRPADHNPQGSRARPAPLLPAACAAARAQRQHGPLAARNAARRDVFAHGSPRGRFYLYGRRGPGWDQQPGAKHLYYILSCHVCRSPWCPYSLRYTGPQFVA
eukprot:scaffold589328_cov46-Prasinocladus_malaysianus.AAC.2